MKLKAIALAVSLSVFGATAFAADLDTSLTDFAVLAGDGTALAAVQTLVATDLVGGTATGDTALIVQEMTADSVAYIDQQTAGGLNFAAIVQTGAGGGAAYIAQSGTNDRALINQHD